jgi:hypothetical protein
MKKVLASVIAGSMASVCLAVTSASAQEGGNGSNFGGTVNSNYGGVLNTSPLGTTNGGGSIPGIAGFNGAVLSQAQALQAKLAAAQAAADKAGEGSGDGVRRFVRAAAPCNCGGGPEQAELNKVKAEVAAFLETTKTPTAGQLGEVKPAAGGAPVSGPSW